MKDSQGNIIKLFSIETMYVRFYLAERLHSFLELPCVDTTRVIHIKLFERIVCLCGQQRRSMDGNERQAAAHTWTAGGHFLLCAKRCHHRCSPSRSPAERAPSISWGPLLSGKKSDLGETVSQYSFKILKGTAKLCLQLSEPRQSCGRPKGSVNVVSVASSCALWWFSV